MRDGGECHCGREAHLGDTHVGPVPTPPEYHWMTGAMKPPCPTILTALVILTQIVSSGGEDSQIKILTRPQTFQRAIGSNITLPCAVRNLDGSVVTWSKDGQVISADNFKVLKDSRITVNHRTNRGVEITITGLSVSDSGSYDCALNLKSHVVNVVHTLQIEVPPLIHKLHPGNGSITVRSGSRVRLECRASGQPPPHIHWSRQHNQPFPWGLGGNLTVPGEVLVMSNISRVFAGDYVCSADNGVGAIPVRESVTLDVLYPPEVLVETEWMHSPEGETVTLVCRVYSNPVARVLWYKDTMKLIEGERIHMSNVGNTYKLNINSVTVGDYGKYYCKASNLLEREVNEVVHLTGAPSVPQVVGSQSSSHVYSYDLVWRVDSSYHIRQHEAVFWPTNLDPRSGDSLPPKTAQSKRIPSAITVDRDGFSYNLKGLTNNTYYDVVIRSQNKFGWSPYSQSFTFQTLDKEKASMKLQNKQDITVFQGEGPLKSEPVVSASRPALPSVPVSALLLLLCVTRSCTGV